MSTSHTAKNLLRRLVPIPKHAIWRATSPAVTAAFQESSTQTSTTTVDSAAAANALLEQDLHQDDILERKSRSFSELYQSDHLKGPKQSTLHAWNRLHPSLGEFYLNPKNQVAVQAMPVSLQERLSLDPNPHTAYKAYQETLSASTQWLNDLVATQMTTPTGESAYTTELLKIYDAMIWRHNSPFHWRIRQDEAQGLYNDCLMGSKSHCEVAVGTGLFLAELDTSSTATTKLEQLLLVDLQQDALQACQELLAQHEYYANHVDISSLHASILDDLPLDNPQVPLGTFDTVAANFLVHCLPRGPGIVHRTFSNCASLLKSDGLFFGTTILGKDLIDDGHQAGEATLQTIRFYNKVGVFGNDQHTFQDFSTVLHDLFEDVEIWRVGYCVAWKARGPKKQPYA